MSAIPFWSIAGGVIGLLILFFLLALREVRRLENIRLHRAGLCHLATAIRDMSSPGAEHPSSAHEGRSQCGMPEARIVWPPFKVDAEIAEFHKEFNTTHPPEVK